MMTPAQLVAVRQRAAEIIRQAGIRLSHEESARIEVVDFGLGDLEKEGAQILTLVQTSRLSVKILVLFPGQTEPEHWHPPVGDDPGKEETIRVVDGTFHLYLPGPDTLTKGRIPDGKTAYYTCRQETIMRRDEQLTLPPGTKHWFQAGRESVVIYSFSTIARDALDCFSDPSVVR
jgi:D-lyxose ketol-isomerase